jgi:peptide/nickel transport system permease protein
MPQLLPTDVLFFLTLFGLFGLLVYSLGQTHLRRPWQKVFQSTQAMVSLVILIPYLLVAVADSIRLEGALVPQAGEGPVASSEPLSLLDLGLQRLRLSVEKTYSAPLQVELHAREMVRLPDGREIWSTPRLRYGGSHLIDPFKERTTDLFRRAIKGFFKGALVWLMLTVPLLAMVVWWTGDKRRVLLDIALGRSRFPWRAVLLAGLFLAMVVGVLAEWAAVYHVLGTDKVGADVLYQSLKSIRTGILIGTLTTVATLPLSLLLGILAGYFRGWVDDVIQYVYTTLNAIPGVLLIAAAMLVMQASMARHEAAFQSLALRADVRLLALCLILGLTSWTGLCRLLRAETLKLRNLEYVQAAKVLGVSQSRILLRHILPNVFHLVLIAVALDFSSLVLAEAVLSYVNIGVDPSTESWGNMINTARLEMAREPVVWWSLASAFCFMLGLVLPANLLADVLRDAFDPRRVS